MCIQLFAIKKHPLYNFIMAANRDEFYDRPTEAAKFWKDGSGILAGRDLKMGGTWMGITNSDKFASVTNYRDPENLDPDALSRGLLVSKFLSEKIPPRTYLDKLENKKNRYNGFNLIIGNLDSLYYYSNRGERIQKLDEGIYGLSNHLLNTPWPKVVNGISRLKKIIDENKRIEPEMLMGILENKIKPPVPELPETGITKKWERILSPIFVKSEKYGTRTSTVILAEKTGCVTFMERTFNINEDRLIRPVTKIFNLS